MDLRNKGKEADVSVGRVECKNVTGAMETGIVQDERDFKVDQTDRGGCVEGVSISLIRAISSGARIAPAILAAKTAIAREARGVGEFRISRPPVAP